MLAKQKESPAGFSIFTYNLIMTHNDFPMLHFLTYGTIFEVILLGLIGIYFIRMIITYYMGRFFLTRRNCPEPFFNHAPGISVIKPVWGLDAGTPDNFRSFCDQDYSQDYEIIFCAENPNDPSIPFIKKIMHEYPEKDIRLVFSDPNDRSHFGKIKNMISGLRESKHELLIFSDSDVRVSKTYFRRIVGYLKDRSIGLVYSPPFLTGAENWKAAMLNMAANENTLNIILLHMIGMRAVAVGTTMAIPRKVVEDIGGIEQFGRQVTDDLPLARAVHKKGYSIQLLKEPVWVLHPEDTFAQWWKHMVRWLVMIRRYIPLAVYAGFLDMPLFISLLYFIISQNITAGVVLAGSVLIFRFVFITLIHIRLVNDKGIMRFIWAIPVMDLLKLPLLIHSIMTNKIEWRTRKIYVNPDGSVLQ